MRPNDPLLNSQWYLAVLGDLESIWDDFTGTGVSVGIYDSGIDYTHVELSGNYDASLHVVYNGTTYDGAPSTNAAITSRYHGTAVAGLIAASANNGTGMAGVAWGSSITGVNIFDPASALSGAGQSTALRQMTNFDVVNNSWNMDLTDSPTSHYAAYTTYKEIYRQVVTNGRDGLGTVIVQSAGNDYSTSSGSAFNAWRYTITVAAAMQDGTRSSYSNNGTNILVIAPGSGIPGSILSTDISGSGGASNGDYTTTFNGTSAAAPLVTGVVTLMLDANPDLGWRDVQEILAVSASHTGSAIGATSLASSESSGWLLNAATDWNGGGRHYSYDYGYGMVNAYNAVRLAEAAQYYAGASLTSTNEVTSTTGSVSANRTITDNATTSVNFTLTTNIVVEQIEVQVSISHQAVSTLSLWLVGPDGEVNLIDTLSHATSTTGISYTFGLDGLRGMSSAGDWTLRIIDSSADGTAGTLNSYSVTAYGSSASSDNVYHFTDELAEMVALEQTRATVTDTNGGSDWINAAALQTASVINLSTGTATIDDVELTLSGMDNIIGGEGDDVLTGDAGANQIVGMRGNDTLDGGAGNDTLIGGEGNDVYHVDAPGDIVTEVAGEGSDTVYASSSFALASDAEIEHLAAATPASYLALSLTGNAFAQLIEGNNGDNTLNSGGGADTLRGFGGNDSYYVDSLDDVIEENAGEGIDRLYASASYVLAAGASVEYLATTLTSGTGDLDLTGNEFGQSLEGNQGDNVLDGGGGGDTMRGYGGDDTYHVRTYTDVVIETANQGYDRVLAWVNFALASTSNIEFLAVADSASTTGLLLVGNSLAQTLEGGAGNDTLDGLGGADTMRGFGGNDIYYVDNAKDVVIEAAGQGTDRLLTKVSYTLATGSSIESLEAAVPTSAAALSLTGNEFAQTILGNSGANIINGGAGADTMRGFGGNDTYYVDNADDVVIETVNGGSDTVLTSVSYALTAGQSIEKLATANASSTAALTLTGNELAQTIEGNAGNNIIDGGLGADKLRGNGGADTFRFSSAPGSGNIDKIMDFVVATDTIALSQSVFSALSVGALTDSAFKDISSAIADTSDRILFNRDTGALFYDSDGSGAAAAVQFATVSANLALSASDFVIYA